MTESRARELLGDHYNNWYLNAVAKRGLEETERRRNYCDLLHDLVNDAFTWSETPERHSYWQIIASGEFVAVLIPSKIEYGKKPGWY